MKRCPQCRRDFFDDSLRYCLDDGVRLLDGPGNEAATIGFPNATAALSPSDESKIARSFFSIAVLPFLDLTPEGGNEYFCDGLAEEILNTLSRIDGLKVAARTSAFSFRGISTSITAIAAALNVATVLEGSVRLSADRLRISVQLTSAADGYSLWSERYDREMRDIFDVQDEIAQAVAQALSPRFFGPTISSVMQYTDNVEAHESYLKGRYCLNGAFLNIGTNDQLQKAIDFFDEAIRIEPHYGPAFAGLARAYTMLSKMGETPASTAELMPKAKQAAAKALELNDQLPEAHVALAAVLTNFEYDFAGAEERYRAALSIAPNDAAVLLGYAGFLTCVGRFTEADEHFRRALEIDPLALDARLKYCQFLIMARRFDDSAAELKKVEELEPALPRVQMVAAVIHELKGEHKEFIDQIVPFIEQYESAEGAAMVRETFDKGGWPAFAKMRLERFREVPGFPATSLASLYTSVGEHDSAFAELEKAFENRESALLDVNVDPQFDALRPDPRYQALLDKIGFPKTLNAEGPHVRD